MKEELLSIETVHTVEYHFISMGLHTRPQKLHAELEQILDAITGGYDRIILGFGLCGGALRGIKAASSILTIPNVHDCIPVFLGSRSIYEHMQETQGTYYLTCGWILYGKPVIGEFQRICGKFGEKKAKAIYRRMYDSYRRVLYLHTGHPQDAVGLKASKETAALLGLEYRTENGSRAYINKLVNGPWNEDEFINLCPGDTLEDAHFSIDKQMSEL